MRGIFDRVHKSYQVKFTQYRATDNQSLPMELSELLMSSVTRGAHRTLISSTLETQPPFLRFMLKLGHMLVKRDIPEVR